MSYYSMALHLMHSQTNNSENELLSMLDKLCKEQKEETVTQQMTENPLLWEFLKSTKNTMEEALQMPHESSKTSDSDIENISDPDIEVIFVKLANHKSQRESAESMKEDTYSVETALKAKGLKPAREYAKTPSKRQKKSEKNSNKEDICITQKKSPSGQEDASKMQGNPFKIGVKEDIFNPQEKPEKQFCCICKGSASLTETPLALCHDCGKYYHNLCHSPKIEELVHGIWICFPCWHGEHSKQNGSNRAENAI